MSDHGSEVLDLAVNRIREGVTAVASASASTVVVVHREALSQQGGEPSTVITDTHVSTRPQARQVVTNPSQSPVDGEPGSLQDCPEEESMLIAIAASSALDQFGLDRFELNRNSTSDDDVKIFEGYCGHVGAVQRRHCLRVTGDGTAIVDSFQICVEVHDLDGPFVVTHDKLPPGPR